MSDNMSELSPGFWRNASRLMSVYGIPAPLFLLYLFWFRFPSFMTIYVITGIIAGFRLLSFFGWTLQVLIARLIFMVRGKLLSGRPWWYRRFNDLD